MVAAVDLSDLEFVAGLVLLWWGCEGIYPPAAPLACGVVLLAVAIWTASRKG